MYIDGKGRETAVICVCPIKNEAWILKRFLTLASQWADYIVIADQNSTDESAEIAKSFDKVIYVVNEGEFNEQKRSVLMLNEVRKIKADKKLVFALDADEALSLNWGNSNEWGMMLEAEPRTVFTIPWIELFKGLKNKGIKFSDKIPFAYIDDEVSNFDSGVTFHLTRVPDIKKPQFIKLSEIWNFHFKYLAENRLKQKNAWYQCFEIVENRQVNFINTFRLYNKDIGYNLEDDKRLVILDKEKLSNEFFNEDLTEVIDDELTWHGIEVIHYLNIYGGKKFSKINMWDYDWYSKAELLKITNLDNFIDPRSQFEKRMHGWLSKTQNNNTSLEVRVIQKILILLFKN
jgi:hypothetical protein